MSRSLDMEQLLIDDLQVLGAPVTGANHRGDERWNQPR